MHDDSTSNRNVYKLSFHSDRITGQAIFTGAIVEAVLFCERAGVELLDVEPIMIAGRPAAGASGVRYGDDSEDY